MKTRRKPVEIEVEAKTTREAIRIALEKLKAKKEDVEIKILREERKGLFGMEGAEHAKVKATVKKKR
jgi:spoIIIJ-associated protein